MSCCLLSECLPMKCYKHPDIDATGVCVDCGRTLCSACTTGIGGKARCTGCVEKMNIQHHDTKIDHKDPWLAVALAILGNGFMLCNGLGAVYNGQIRKGIIITTINWVLWTLTGIIFIVTFKGVMGWGMLVAFMVVVFPLIYAVCVGYDAYLMAKTVNKGEYVKDWLA